MKNNATLELYKEYPQRDLEAATALRIITLMEKQMVKNFEGGRMLRDVHSKGHGCVRAEFTVRPDLPEELRVGIFEQPRTFDAVIRFSNAGALAPIGGVATDITRDARGMAIKLVGVPGEKILEDQRDADTQDFLMFTPDTFFCPGPDGFFDLMVALTTNRLVFGWFLLRNPSISLSLITSLKKHANLLELQYFSAVPYQFGSRVVKYSAKPIFARQSELPDSPSPDYLRERMQAQLAQEEANFDFMVQFQADPYAMPIENGLVSWAEESAPFLKVARIKILRQRFDSAEQLEDCDNLSFTPWHSLPEHRPLGSISRVRRLVYDAISKFRHQKNEVPRQEPTVDDIR